MRTNPAPQRFGDGEGDQEVGHRQEQTGVSGQPLVGVGLAALGTMPIIAGMIGVVVGAAVRAEEERAAQGGGVTGQELLKHLALTRGHVRAESVQIDRAPTLEQVLEPDRPGISPRGGRGRHGRHSQIGHEGVESFLVLGLTEAGQVGIDDGGGGAFVAEVDLNLSEVFALFEQVGGIRVTKPMDRGVFLDAAGFQGEAEAALEGAAAHGPGGGGSALAIVAFGREEEFGMAMRFPERAQEPEGPSGQRNVAVPIAFAGADMNDHALGVDVAHFQSEGFSEPEAAGIDRGQGGAVVGRRHGRQYLADLLGGEHHGQFELRGGAGEGDLGGPGPLQGLFPEEFHRADRLSGTLTRETPLQFQMEEVLAKVFGAELVGGPLEVFGHLPDTGQVGLLATRLQGQQTQVVGEAV